MLTLFSGDKLLSQASPEKLCLKLHNNHHNDIRHWFLIRLTGFIPKPKPISSVGVVENGEKMHVFVSCLCSDEQPKVRMARPGQAFFIPEFPV